jgi:putative oxidoreductase
MNRLAFPVFELPARVGESLAWLPPLLARITVGWVFLSTGWGKLHNLPKIVEFFTSLGIPYPELQAPFVATTELVCGTLVLVGLFTRLAALPLIGTMVVAIATALWSDVENLAGFLGLVETLYIVFFVWLAIDGAGPISLDAVLERAVVGGARRETAARGARTIAT